MRLSYSGCVIIFCSRGFAGAGLHIHAVQAIGIVGGDYPLGCKSRIVSVISLPSSWA